MSKPVVAIVGRPNVGKSTLFNALAGEKIAIVKDTPGVTRDRIYAEVNWLDKEFTLIDTGGIEPDSRDVILSQMREQAQIAIDTADVILFMTDVNTVRVWARVAAAPGTTITHFGNGQYFMLSQPVLYFTNTVAAHIHSKNLFYNVCCFRVGQ